MWLFSQDCYFFGFETAARCAVFLTLWSFPWVHSVLQRWKVAGFESSPCITATCLVPCYWPNPVRCSSQSKNKTCSQCDVWNSLTGEGKGELYCLYHLTLGRCENWKVLRHSGSLSDHLWVCQQQLQRFRANYKAFIYPSVHFCLENFLLVNVR